MVAGAAAHNTLPRLGRVQVGHLVVGTAQLEAEDGLLIFALEEDVVPKAVAEVDGGR